MPEVDETYPVIRIPGLPDFNEANQEIWVITELGNWDSAAPPKPVLTPRAGFGAEASGDWAPAEEYYTLQGFVRCPPEQHGSIWRALLAALPADREVPLVRLGNGWDPDMQVAVRRYDRPIRNSDRYRLVFTFPLVATDPYKYALAPVSGELGVFTGQTWYGGYVPRQGPNDIYVDTSGAWSQNYQQQRPGVWTDIYQQAVDTGPYPLSLQLISQGTVASRRVTIEVTGPLDAGDWWLLHENTGFRLWAEVALGAGQTLAIDCATGTATVNGSDASHLLFGDYFTLLAGANVFRLVSGSPNRDAYASIKAYEAYE